MACTRRESLMATSADLTTDAEMSSSFSGDSSPQVTRINSGKDLGAPLAPLCKVKNTFIDGFQGEDDNFGGDMRITKSLPAHRHFCLELPDEVPESEEAIYAEPWAQEYTPEPWHVQRHPQQQQHQQQNCRPTQHSAQPLQQPMVELPVCCAPMSTTPLHQHQLQLQQAQHMPGYDAWQQPEEQMTAQSSNQMKWSSQSSLQQNQQHPRQPAAPCVVPIEKRAPEYSVGSASHGIGECKPCAWFWRPQGCSNGSSCRHCHLCGLGEVRQRRKQKLAAWKAEAELSASAVCYCA